MSCFISFFFSKMCRNSGQQKKQGIFPKKGRRETGDDIQEIAIHSASFAVPSDSPTLLVSLFLFDFTRLIDPWDAGFSIRRAGVAIHRAGVAVRRTGIAIRPLRKKTQSSSVRPSKRRKQRRTDENSPRTGSSIHHPFRSIFSSDSSLGWRIRHGFGFRGTARSTGAADSWLCPSTSPRLGHLPGFGIQPMWLSPSSSERAKILHGLRGMDNRR